MPSKSRRKKDKRSFQGKKSKGGLVRPTISAQQTAAAQTREPVSRPAVPAPSAKVPTSAAKLTAVQYPYLATELRTIGILAGIMFIILVILALVPR